MIVKKLLKAEAGEGTVFWYRQGDRYIGERVALGKYEPYLTKLILGQAREGARVVDAGANIGYYTVLLAKRVGRRGRVFAFEPERECFEILKKNIKENKLSNVTAVRAALGNRKGRAVIFRSEENFGNHKLYGRGKGQAVETVRLDDYLEGEKVDLIKIDTQGWEPEVVAGAEKLIIRWRPVIFMEYSPISYKEAGLDGRAMVNFLREMYGEIRAVDEWLYTFGRVKGDPENYVNPKTGYADLWMGGRDTLWRRWKDVRIKKLVKKIVGMDYRR